MNTKAFYKSYTEGNMGDDFEYIRWTGEYETLTEILALWFS
jgi:hypothetical protein